MASIFLAAKVEERPKRMKEVLNVFYHTFRKRKNLPAKPLELNGEVSFINNLSFGITQHFSIVLQRYMRWSIEMVKTERSILKELGFRLYGIMEHPQ